MECHKLLGDARVYELLLEIDRDLAATARPAGCRECGGRLDVARYPRKVRGVPAGVRVPAEYGWRMSFTCRGCERRHTPPSVRFLGRRVYLGAVVVLAAAMLQGPTPWRARRLRQLFDVSVQTLRRWQSWWQEAFADSEFWKVAKAAFVPPVDELASPSSLLERFAGTQRERLVALLRFLTPITTPTGYEPDRCR